MDNTSIITQVANPKEEESISSSQDKGKAHTNITHTVVVFMFACLNFLGGISRHILFALLGCQMLSAAPPPDVRGEIWSVQRLYFLNQLCFVLFWEVFSLFVLRLSARALLSH